MSMSTQKSLLNIWYQTAKQASKNISVGGLSHSLRAETNLGKLIWFTLFIFGIMWTLVNANRVIQQYMNLPYTTTIDTKHNHKLSYPAITFCNQNRASCFKITKTMLDEIEDVALNRSAVGLSMDLSQYPLLRLYNITHCGIEGISCAKAFLEYANYYLKVKKPLPDVLKANDVCLHHCPFVFDAFEDACLSLDIEGRTADIEKLNFIWNEMECTHELLKTMATWKTSFLDNIKRRPKTPENYFEDIYDSLSSQQQMDIGYHLEDLVFGCKLADRECSEYRQTHENMFIKFLHPAFGVCHSFNFWGNLRANFSGRYFGLTLTLHVDADSYLPQYLTSRQGIRLVVHSPRTAPHLRNLGLDVSVDTATSIAISKTRMQRLSQPYAPNCTNSWNETQFELKGTLAKMLLQQNTPEEFEYTLEFCQQLCTQSLLMDVCKCYSALWPRDFTFNGTDYGHFPLCVTSRDRDTRRCIGEKFYQIIEKEIYANECGCHVGCSEVRYILSISSAKWPPTVLKESIKLHFQDLKRVEGNVLLVELFYNSLNEEVHTQTPRFQDVLEFVGNIGGIFSLYLGISMVSVFEVLQFIFLLVWNSVLYICGKDSFRENAGINTKSNKVIEIRPKSLSNSISTLHQ